MTLRTQLPERKKLAHEILDLVRAGQHVEASRIRWALVVTGDLYGGAR